MHYLDLCIIIITEYFNVYDILNIKLSKSFTNFLSVSNEDTNLKLSSSYPSPRTSNTENGIVLGIENGIKGLLQLASDDNPKSLAIIISYSVRFIGQDRSDKAYPDYLFY